jgi:hypothetical protein
MKIKSVHPGYDGLLYMEDGSTYLRDEEDGHWEILLGNYWYRVSDSGIKEKETFIEELYQNYIAENR